MLDGFANDTIIEKELEVERKEKERLRKKRQTLILKITSATVLILIVMLIYLVYIMSSKTLPELNFSLMADARIFTNNTSKRGMPSVISKNELDSTVSNLLEEGQKSFELQQYNKAILSFEQSLIRIDLPERLYDKIKLYLALCYLETNQRNNIAQELLLDLSSKLETIGADVHVYGAYNLGVLYFQMQKKKQALDIFIQLNINQSKIRDRENQIIDLNSHIELLE